MQEIIQRHSLRERVENEEPLVGFETEPGAHMQVDWVEFPKDGCSAFVATIGYSRTSYVEYVTDEKVDTLITHHELSNTAAKEGCKYSEYLYEAFKSGSEGKAQRSKAPLPRWQASLPSKPLMRLALILP